MMYLFLFLIWWIIGIIVIIYISEKNDFFNGFTAWEKSWLSALFGVVGVLIPLIKLYYKWKNC